MHPKNNQIPWYFYTFFVFQRLLRGARLTRPPEGSNFPQEFHQASWRNKSGRRFANFYKTTQIFQDRKWIERKFDSTLSIYFRVKFLLSRVERKRWKSGISCARGEPGQLEGGIGNGTHLFELSTRKTATVRATRPTTRLIDDTLIWRNASRISRSILIYLAPFTSPPRDRWIPFHPSYPGPPHYSTASSVISFQNSSLRVDPLKAIYNARYVEFIATDKLFPSRRLWIC